MRDLAAELREALIRSTRYHGLHALCLSGGIDSATALAASLAAGIKPTCYTFTVAGREPSEDFRIAKEMCLAHDVIHHPVIVPCDPKQVIRDIQLVLPYITYHGSSTPDSKAIYKVWVQCVIPMMYVTRAILHGGFKRAGTAFCADMYYGSGLQHNKIFYAEGLEAWKAYREKYVVHPLNADWVVQGWAKNEGLDLIDVFAHPAVRDLMLSTEPEEVQKPRPKQVALDAFPEFWVNPKWYRPNKSLQVVSGVREDHDRLLEDPTINPKGHKAVIALYYDMARAMGLPTSNGPSEHSLFA